jgi:hypothetical protein
MTIAESSTSNAESVTVAVALKLEVPRDGRPAEERLAEALHDLLQANQRGIRYSSPLIGSKLLQVTIGPEAEEMAERLGLNDKDPETVGASA